MASGRIKQAQVALQKLIARYTKEMNSRVPIGLHAPDDVGLAGISSYDGTGGFDNRPDFVKEDDEKWAKS
jgi:hypothetical protein